MSRRALSRGERIARFYRSLDPAFPLPEGVGIMHPYRDPQVMDVVQRFYRCYYDDERPRIILFGINPGRFGAGITGIPFTDPIHLEADCGIPHTFAMKPELSSGFVYAVVQAYGGPAAFFGDFFVSALSPLGFVREGRNLNYYDDRALQQASTPFILSCIRAQQRLLSAPDACFCLGEGSNYRYFTALNQAEGLFSQIIPLPHPRWVMQYRRRQLDDYVGRYVEALRAAAGAWRLGAG